MKIKKYFIQVIIAVGLIVGTFVTLIVQASSKDACPMDKITDRRAFMEGVIFVNNIRLNHPICLREKERLAGLEGVKVLVENLPTSVERFGLTPQLLQTDIELRLRMHGIKIRTMFQSQDEKLNRQDSPTIQSSFKSWKEAINAESDEDFLQFARETVRRELFDTSETPTLYIRVNITMFEQISRAAFSVLVELKEGAYLCRNGAYSRAPIWNTGGVGGCSTSALKEYVRECLRDYLDEFINDYLAANPKDYSSEEAQ